MKSIILLFSFFVITTIIFAQQVDKPAPDFILSSVDGSSVKLSDYKGKVVFLFLFGNTCPNCIAAAPSVNKKIIEAYSSNPKFIALGLDVWDGNQALVKDFAAKTSSNYKLLMKASPVADLYTTTYDRLMVIDQDGILRHRGSTGAANDVDKAAEIINKYLTLSTWTGNIINEPDKLLLYQNYPNPFKETTSISFYLDEPQNLNIQIFNTFGESVFLLQTDFFIKGFHKIELNLPGLKKGIYFCYLNNGKKLLIKKIIAG